MKSLVRQHPAVALGAVFVLCLALNVAAEILAGRGAPHAMTVSMAIVGACLGIVSGGTALWVLTRRLGRRHPDGRRSGVRWLLLSLRWITLLVGGVVLVAIAAGTGAYFDAFTSDAYTADGRALSCDWPAHFHGKEMSRTDVQGEDIWPDVAILTGQEGAVRCYLKALAEGDLAQMEAVTAPGWFGDKAFRGKAFLFSKDAKSGIASVSFKQNADDDSDAEVEIRFADGNTDVQQLSVVDPQSWNGWRFTAVNDHPTVSRLNLGPRD